MPTGGKDLRGAAIVLTSIAAIAVVTLYWIHYRNGSVNVRHITTPSAPKTPVNHAAVKRSVPTRISQSNDDSVVAARLDSSMDSRTIVKCRAALLQMRPVEGRENCDYVNPNDVTGMQLCQRTLASDAARIKKFTAEAASCPQSLAKASNYYDALRGAAQNGDINAQQCFIRGYFQLVESGDYITQQQRDEYVVLAQGYISSGLARGDWGLVHWLARVSLGVTDGLLFEAYPFGNSAPETLYKMNLLLTLGGATDEVVERPQSVVSYKQKSGELSDQQLQDAEQWAQQTYNTYFAATPYDSKAAAASFCRNDY